MHSMVDTTFWIDYLEPEEVYGTDLYSYDGDYDFDIEDESLCPTIRSHLENKHNNVQIKSSSSLQV